MLTRRELLRALAAAAALTPADLRRAAAAAIGLNPAPPAHGGAGPAAPSPPTGPAHLQRTLDAYADTLVPSEPGFPGAAEAGAARELADPFYGVAPFLPALVADLDAAALRAHGRPFADLDYPSREGIVAARIVDQRVRPLYLATLPVVYASFYASVGDPARLGETYIGFPGPSEGYVGDHSYREAFGQPEGEAVPP